MGALAPDHHSILIFALPDRAETGRSPDLCTAIRDAIRDPLGEDRPASRAYIMHCLDVANQKDA